MFRFLPIQIIIYGWVQNVRHVQLRVSYYLPDKGRKFCPPLEKSEGDQDNNDESIVDFDLTVNKA